MNKKLPSERTIAHSAALAQDTRHQVQAIRAEVERGRRLVEESRKLLDATKPKGGKPNQPS